MMRHRSRSDGLSPLVAVILLIAITVAAAVIVSGVFFNLAGIAGRRPTAIIDQVKVVTTPAGSGQWAIVIKNTGDVPITAITATTTGCGTPTFAIPLGGVLPGNTIGATSPATAGCTLGTTYRITLTVTFAGGSTQVLITQATAELA
jgi:flagellin-like protein